MKVEDIIGGLFMIVVGITLISSREKFVDSVVKVNNAGLGFYRYGKVEKKAGQWMIIGFGIIAILIGLLIMIGKFWTK